VKRFILITVLGVLFTGFAAAAPRPNLIFMLADDLGYGDVQCYGAPDIKTPNLDRLAREGVRFTDAYAAFPVCSPSRAAFLTGRYMQRFGPSYEDYFGGGAPGLDPAKHPTIGRILKDAGYATGCFGKWNVNNADRATVGPNAHGFDRWVGLHLNHDYFTHRVIRTGELDLYENGQPLEREGWSDTIFADEAIRFLAEKRNEPFFIYLPWQTPHDPLHDPNVPGDPPKKAAAELREIYIRMVERLDHEVGRVLNALEENGVAKNTFVIFTSDNGGARASRNLPLRGAKQELYEGGIRVPLLMRWPGVLPAGEVSAAMTISMDYTATLVAAAGATPPAAAPFDGLNLLPILTGKQPADPERTLYWRRRTVDMKKGRFSIRQSAVRQGDWKYLRRYRPAGDGTFGAKYVEELYHLKDDLSEKEDLSKTDPARVAKLRSMLEAWETETRPDERP
jgi:arylsulfatase A